MNHEERKATADEKAAPDFYTYELRFDRRVVDNLSLLFRYVGVGMVLSMLTELVFLRGDAAFYDGLPLSVPVGWGAIGAFLAYYSFRQAGYSARRWVPRWVDWAFPTLICFGLGFGILDIYAAVVAKPELALIHSVFLGAFPAAIHGVIALKRKGFDDAGWGNETPRGG